MSLHKPACHMIRQHVTLYLATQLLSATIIAPQIEMADITENEHASNFSVGWSIFEDRSQPKESQ